MTKIDYRNGVSIAEIAVYVPALIIAIFLAIRHGIGRSSGWVFLIIFTLARIIGPGMQLATISDPHNQALYTGSAILNNVGLSPLEMAALGFLSRLISSISKSHNTVIKPQMIQLVQLIIVVGLILGIVGGINASDAYVKAIKTGGSYQPSTLNKAGTALLIVSYVLLIAFTAVTYPSIQHAEPGEKRLFLAVVLSFPFLLVRTIYSALSTYTHDHDFNLLNGSVTVLLCVALIEEFIVVIIFEVMGLTLQKAVKEEHVEAATHYQSGDSDMPMPAQKKSGGDNTALRIAKKTIIGRVVMAALPNKEKEVEMQRGYVRRQ